MQLTDREFSIWSSDAHAWVGVIGDFVLQVGSSSADTQLRTKVTQGPPDLCIEGLRSVLLVV